MKTFKIPAIPLSYFGTNLISPRFSSVVIAATASTVIITDITPVAVKTALHLKNMDNILAISGPAKPAMLKRVHIIRACVAAVFSDITFISGPRSMESPKPISANAVKCRIRLSKMGMTKVLTLLIPSPIIIIYFGCTRSPIKPFISCPTA